MDIERRRFLSKIARLYYIEGLTQQNIANKLSISRTKVSRYLTLARKENIVEININNPTEDFSNLEYHIEKKYHLKECTIVDTMENREAVIESMGDSFNNLLSRLIDNSSYIGIGWGRSLRELSNHIDIMDLKDIKVVPMIGGLGKTGTGVHTNSVAQKIAERMGGVSYIIHSPAVMDSREVKEIMEKDRNVKEIMDMSLRVSTAIIGLSDLGDESTLIRSGSFTREDFKYLEDLGVVGDVNLIFIDSQGNHVNNRIDERIVRVPLDRLRKIKNVIGVAFGKSKKEVILGALRGHIINILFTDKSTAENIIKADRDGK